MTDVSIREILSSAIKFWERARILYNAVLFGVLAIVYITGLPFSRDALSIQTFEEMFMAGFMANVFYSFAYLPDVAAQLSDYREKWLHYRWVLFTIGMLFASVWVQFISSAKFFPAN